MKTLNDICARPRAALTAFLCATALGAGALALAVTRTPLQSPVAMAPMPEATTVAVLPKPVVPTESLALAARFEEAGYDWEALVSGTRNVPSVAVKRLPADLVHLQNTDLRKSLFFRALLPLALEVNAQVHRERTRLLTLKAGIDAGDAPSPRDAAWLADLARRYKTDADDWEELALRVDEVPVSLLLAQAAEESGWGTSRFVREGNALFGQWTWSQGGKAMVPGSRDAGETHKIKSFDSVKGAVAAYVRNLNSHAAYARFRLERALGASGYDLAGSLENYSERGPRYVSSLRSIIQGNRLSSLDDARLSRGEIQVVSR